MKRIGSALFASVSGLFGLVMVPTLLYNLAGLFKIQDGADGPMWEMTLVVLACLGLVSGAFFLSYRLFQSPTMK
jgi:hypothetical protein